MRSADKESSRLTTRRLSRVIAAAILVLATFGLGLSSAASASDQHNVTRNNTVAGCNFDWTTGQYALVAFAKARPNDVSACSNVYIQVVTKSSNRPICRISATVICPVVPDKGVYWVQSQLTGSISGMRVFIASGLTLYPVRNPVYQSSYIW